METLNKLDEEASKLQKDGNYLEALKKVEQALIIRKSAFGSESEEVLTSSRQLCELCNLLAMVYLQKESFDLALDLLKKSEALSDGNDQCKAVTYNNMACFYRRVGKLRAALTYLQKALSIESRISECESPADTHLNMCAVLSQLGKHEEALEHAMEALILLQEEIINKVLINYPETNPQIIKKFEDRSAVLAIAYHNMGVEYEFLKQFGEALGSYNKAYEFSLKQLGPDHAITNNLRGVYETAKKQMEEMQEKEERRRRAKIKTQGLHSQSKQINRATYSAASSKKSKRPQAIQQENQEQEIENVSSSVIENKQQDSEMSNEPMSKEKFIPINQDNQIDQEEVKDLLKQKESQQSSERKEEQFNKQITQSSQLQEVEQQINQESSNKQQDQEDKQLHQKTTQKYQEHINESQKENQKQSEKENQEGQQPLSEENASTSQNQNKDQQESNNLENAQEQKEEKNEEAT